MPKSSPLKGLKTKEIRYLSEHKCAHRHTYLEHFKCYERDFKLTRTQKVLFFDLETTAHDGFYWGKNWETNIIENVEYGKILCYAAKWNDKPTFVRGWVDFKSNEEKELVKELWKLLDEADVVVAHNGKSFDIKWCNTKFTQYRLPKPSSYKVVDTKCLAKKVLYLPSYSLNNIADYYGLGRKVEHEGFSLWKKCISGDREAWKRMKHYNKVDVDLLERVYLKLVQWI